MRTATMRYFVGALLLGLALGVQAFGDYEDNRTQAEADAYALSLAKAQAVAAAGAKAGGGSVTQGDVDAAAVSPNPSAHAPSAQCRYGTSVTGAGIGFGAGISVSDWDRICGLWMAAQQTTGTAQKEAAAAAFCLTMQDAGVHSKVCEEWNKGQGEAEVAMNGNEAKIVFSGANTR